MRFLFRKRKPERESARNLIRIKLHSLTIKLQKKLANWLHRNTRGFKRRHWIALLILFVLPASGMSAYLMISAIWQNTQKGFSLNRITRPEIGNFNDHIDSLKKNKAYGKARENTEDD